MNSFNTSLILEVAANVFEQMLNSKVTEYSDDDFQPHETDYLAKIEIAGSSTRYIALAAPELTARKIAAAMFQMEEVELSDADLRDALGEVTNMMGGSAKGVDEDSTRLRLPQVAQRHEEGPGPPFFHYPKLCILLDDLPLYLSWGIVPCAERTCQLPAGEGRTSLSHPAM